MVTDEPSEANRFGWIVELDAEEPLLHTPVKHTAMGRFQAQGATIALFEPSSIACG